MEEILENIKKKIDTTKVYLYRNYKQISVGDDLSDIKHDLKKKYNEPSKNIKVYLISFYTSNMLKDPFVISCTQYTLTPNLELKWNDDDIMQKILYTREYLKNIGFRLGDINKIIKGVKNKLISTRITVKVYMNDVNKAIKKN